ncbi:MAG TPA: hypothetical protein VL251_09975 [Thermomonas sp.]|nr:hypothetical protein [Thermomonas sp.]
MRPEAIEDRIAHDLKAALSPIRTSAYVLRHADTLAAGTRADMVAVIERQAGRLAAMVDEAREWRRCAGGALVLRPEPLDLPLLADLACGGLQCDPQLRWEGAPPGGFYGDARAVQRMLAAVLACACARDPGHAPDCSLEADASRLRLVARDRGGACDPEALLREPSVQPGEDGLGLGLLVAAAIARAHGGGLRAAVPADGGLRLVCEVAALPAA